MNILLWILQVLLALYSLTGALYMMGNHADLAQVWALNTLPGAFWTLLGAFQIIFALGMVIPQKFLKLPRLTSISAGGLALIFLLGIALYSEYANFPGLLWGLIPAAVLAFIAYQRAEGTGE